jgi:hypothetical protein
VAERQACGCPDPMWIQTDCPGWVNVILPLQDRGTERTPEASSTLAPSLVTETRVKAWDSLLRKGEMENDRPQTRPGAPGSH